MPITTTPFGMLAGREITAFTLQNSNAMQVMILDLGGIITELHVPGRNGVADVVLGCNTLAGYTPNPAYLGAIVGRFANRIGGARFTLNGITRQLDVNEPPNHLHGGFHGFNSHCWQAEAYPDQGDLCLRLTRRSPDGEGGYPGNLDTVITYRVTADNSLAVEITATGDQDTPVSLTQHSYFNLAGHNAGDIRGHQLRLYADYFTETDEQLLPTGNILPVAGTPYDFTQPTAVDPARQDLPSGYDTNYVVRGTPGDLRPAAELHEAKSGRTMTVATTKPGIQLYDGTYLTALQMAGKGATHYPRWAGLCLETQHFPDAVNRPEFPSPILRAGERYEHVTVFSFSVR
jgi:aldose 1-epimerase